MMFGFGSFNLINEFEQASNEPNTEQLGSVTTLGLVKKTCMLDYDNLYGDEFLVIAN